MIRTLLVTACLFAPVAALASPQVEALAQCIAGNTTGKDRKDLAKWLFVAMSTHAEMRSFSKVEPTAHETFNRSAGQLFNRLLTVNCAGEVRGAIQTGGSVAIQSAFQTLGQLAMQELMTDRNVASAMGAVDRHIDRQKLDALAR